MAETTLKNVLENIGLSHLIQRFQDQKIDINTVNSLTDKDLITLGIETIGDRARLRNYVQHMQTPPGTSTDPGSSSEMVPNTSSRMAMEIGSLFGPSRSRFSNRMNRKEKSACKQRTWTGKFLCLCDKKKEKPPTSEEKMTLQKGGLGCKKIQFNSTDEEEKVYKMICNEFLPLKDCGGFELLRCRSNCRMLQVIEGKWDIQNLKNLVGSQCTIYIRPIQRNIVMPTNVPEENEIKEECYSCKELVLVSQLRNHLDECQGSLDISDTDLPEIPLINRSYQDTVEMPLPSLNEVQVVNEVTANLPQEQTAAEMFVDHEDLINDVFQAVHKDSVSEVVKQTAEFSTQNNINNPVEILRLFQKEIVTGRKLDIDNEADALIGLTNFIMIDRNNCLQTALEEIGSIEDLRLCLEVQFFGEEAKDLGGPRKEFFTLVLQRIQEEYFNPVKEWSDDYETIGKIMALSTLQKGKLPRILSAELLTEVFVSETPRKFVKDLRTGLDSLGLFKLVYSLPMLVHLFTPQTTPLTFRMLSTMIRPRFSIDGSNQRMLENTTYQLFIKYLREAAAGRRPGVGLNHVLRFVTGADEEPVLGFSIEPSLHFVQSSSFLPTSSTCANRLNLTVPGELPMPSTQQLFNLFDYAFLNSYFGFE